MFDFILGNAEKRKMILNFLIIALIGLILLIVFNFFFYSTKSYSRLTNWVDPQKYQAVFLSNGQVYFGRVDDINSETLILTDVYYLKSYQALQAGEENREPAENFTLVKLGNEIHGPEDGMSINLDHVIFVENLKSDSKVMEAIKKTKNL